MLTRKNFLIFLATLLKYLIPIIFYYFCCDTYPSKALRLILIWFACYDVTTLHSTVSNEKKIKVIETRLNNMFKEIK